MFKTQLGKVVEEDSAHTALLIAVLEVKIFVAPLLETRVLVLAKRRQGITATAVEVHGIFFKAVVRRQVHAAAKPAHGLLAGMPGRNHAHVHVHRGHIGIARVEHQRNTHGLERRAGQFGPVLRGRRRQLRAAHMREAAASALEHAAAFDDAGNAVALQQLTRRLAPGVGDGAGAARALCRFERTDNARLQIDQVAAHTGHGAFGVEGLAHGFLMAR